MATTSTCSTMSQGCWMSRTCRCAARSTTDDAVAQRKKCAGLRPVRAALQAEARRTARRGEQLLPVPRSWRTSSPGAFFVLNGVMLFVAEVGETEYKKSTVGENEREAAARASSRTAPSLRCTASPSSIRLSEEDGQIVVAADIPESPSEKTRSADTSTSFGRSAMTRRSPASRICTRSASRAARSRSGSRTPRSHRPTSWRPSRWSPAIAPTT